MRICRLLVLLIAFLPILPLSQPVRAEVGQAPADRLVLAYYYPWFDMNTWSPSIVSDMPAVKYVSADRNTIARHIGQARSSGIDAFVSAWLGRGNQTDSNLATMLSLSQGTPFRAGIVFETNSPFMGSQQAIVDGLRYVISTHGSNPNFLKLGGKPVIFFWALRSVPTAPGQTALQAWDAIRQQVDPGRSTVWIAEGTDISYQSVFDGHHLYSIAWSTDVNYTLKDWSNRIRNYNSQNGTGKLWVATVMPGYDDMGTGRPDAFIRSREDGAFYSATFNAAISSQPDWIIITSWNEWVEGTQIEPSVTYGDKYLAMTKQYSDRYKASALVSTSSSGSVAADFGLPNGRFYTQTGSGGRGFSVTNDQVARFWDEFQRLGGVDRLGFPASQRFVWDGFVTQVFQKAILQWRPDSGRVAFVNVFDEMHKAGKDDWLRVVRSTPKPLGPDFDQGKGWDQIVRDRLTLLEANPAIRDKYYSAGDWLALYGLPTSRVEDMGSHYAIRLQRAVIQQWKVEVPWARAGQATVANGGDVSIEAGMYAGTVLSPVAP
ncbi:MAG: glycoside hydrolase family 99-like domain-containing protein [Chloroflexi bacterium]|nr:glycoside hydrolase family 99-like domain-containing protein [Chloroflexota bacterium]